jgi:hypothetical protein
MARWTNWRKIAKKGIGYTGELDWSGPSIYELSVTGPRGGNRLTKYLGETLNEKVRISKYAKNGSHLWELIDEEFENGNLLWYRSLRMKSKELAVIKERQLLNEFNYPWNKKHNSY